MIVLNTNIKKGENRYITGNGKIAIIVTTEYNQKNLTINQSPLTTVGTEIFKLFQHKVSDSYLLDFARELKKNARDIKICAYGIRKIEDGRIEFEEKDLLADDPSNN